jgi:hypothetical protein
MRAFIFSLCFSYLSFLCSVKHTIGINVNNSNRFVKYDIAKIFVLDHRKDEKTHLVFFTLKIVNSGSSTLRFMYSDLKIINVLSRDHSLQLLPQASLITSVAPLPLEIHGGKTLTLELFFTVDKLIGNYELIGLTH